jgi:hypothetical protein
MSNDPPFESFVDDCRGCVMQSERARTTGRFARRRESRAPGRRLNLGHNWDTSAGWDKCFPARGSALSGPRKFYISRAVMPVLAIWRRPSFAYRSVVLMFRSSCTRSQTCGGYAASGISGTPLPVGS